MGAISVDNGEHYVWGDGCDGWHLLKSPGLSVIQERVPPGKAETPHRHHRADQFFYVLSGVATLVVAGDAVTLAQGQGMHVPAGVPHQFKNEAAATVEFLVISSPPSHGDRENLVVAPAAS